MCVCVSLSLCVTAGNFTFTVETLNVKLYFLCSVTPVTFTKRHLKCTEWNLEPDCNM